MILSLLGFLSVFHPPNAECKLDVPKQKEKSRIMTAVLLTN
jgi:hypothetical protein